METCNSVGREIKSKTFSVAHSDFCDQLLLTFWASFPAICFSYSRILSHETCCSNSFPLLFLYSSFYNSLLCLTCLKTPDAIQSPILSFPNLLLSHTLIVAFLTSYWTLDTTLYCSWIFSS